MVTYLQPQPNAHELPARLANPFCADPPHALVQRAAMQLQDELREGKYFPPHEFTGAHRGKMFGVLLVRDGNGQVGFIKGFSGTVQNQWQIEGFVGPLFDVAARDSIWPPGREKLRVLADEIGALDAAVGALTGAGNSHAARDAMIGARSAARRCQTELSNELLQHFFAGYRLTNAHGETCSLQQVFAPHSPPGGAGDCAAPKLFAFAHQHRLQPVALAEFWWGTPASTAGRHMGSFYPACRNKCGPILRFMLQGTDMDGDAADDGAAALTLRVVFEDDCLMVVEKPLGLLCVSGRSGLRRDALQTRLRQGRDFLSVVVPQLDQDCTGLVLAAKDRHSYAALQKQFFTGLIEKTYLALVDGNISEDRGLVALPLRADPGDPRRQICDADNGKPALTYWRVLHRDGKRTRIAFIPRTCRNHQVRVHAQRGLAAPITGDALYGQKGPRLMLHAQSLTLFHPQTGQQLKFDCPTPF